MKNMSCSKTGTTRVQLVTDAGLQRLPRSSAIAIAAVVALSACSTDDNSSEDAANTTEPGQGQEEAFEAEEPAEAEASEGATNGGDDIDTTESTEAAEDTDGAEGTEVKIGTEFTDEETGDIVTIVSAVRNNPTEYYEASDSPHGEMVYVEVKAVPGDTYGGTISSSDFYLDSAGVEANYTASAQDELEAAGYDYFDFAPRREGEHTGYVPIFVKETADELTGSYIRPEAKVLGEDKKVPEFEASFKVPAN